MPSPTFTPRFFVIEIGNLQGAPGGETQATFDFSEPTTITSMHLEIEYVDEAFDVAGPPECTSSSEPDIQIVADASQTGVLAVDIAPTPPSETFTFPSGTFISCVFNVTGLADTYPISLLGTIIDAQGEPIVVAADGQFVISCFNDDHCPPGEVCDFDSEQCVPTALRR